MAILSGWGRYPSVSTEIVVPRSSRALQDALSGDGGTVARGCGRAYGDAAIGVRRTLRMEALDRVRSFDAETGVLTAEAGLTLSDLIATFGPRGFFPFVVPGTRFVTLGGAIAADVHGKNHHRVGSFGDHVLGVDLATADGQVLRASQTENPELFAATLGGMGLTGVILQATLKLMPVETGWITQKVIAASDLAAAVAALDEGDASTYSVAWIDCSAKGRRMGRSLIFLGEHARLDEVRARTAIDPFSKLRAPRLTMPVDLPRLCLNRWSVGAFNALYYHRGRRGIGEPYLMRADRYFFPLDVIADWNRLYGRRGFVQYQCVVPPRSVGVLAEMLQRIAVRGDASFLGVLKKLGPGRGLMSFPREGYTLALDFPFSEELLRFLDELDGLLVKAGGRLYLAKDARQSRATFEAGYPDLGRFREIKSSLDPKGRIQSHLAARLGI